MGLKERIRSSIRLGQQLLDDILLRRDSFIARLVRKMYLVVKGFVEDRCVLQAAALAFTSLISIVPLLATALLAFKLFGTGEEEVLLVERIRDLIARVLPESVLAGGGQSLAQLIAGRLHEFATRMSASRVGGVGLLFLIVTAVSVLRTAEKSLNGIWGVVRGRHFFRRLVVYWAMVTLGPILLVAALSTRLIAGSQAAIEWITAHIPLAWVGDVVQSSFVPIVFMTIALTIFYKIMPSAHVRLRSAFVGAVVGAVLSVIVLDAFGFAIALTGKAQYFAFVYGAIAVVPLLLFFVYAEWAVVLLGAEISFADQNAETYFQEHRAARVSMKAKIRVALRIMGEVTSRFTGGGKPFSLEQMQEQLGLPQRIFHGIVFQLGRAGLLLSPDDAKGCLVPARDPKGMTVGDVVGAMTATGDELPLPADVLGQRIDAVLESIREAMEPPASKTLESIVEG